MAAGKNEILHAESKTPPFTETHQHTTGARFPEPAFVVRLSELPREESAPPCLPEVRLLQGPRSGGR